MVNRDLGYNLYMAEQEGYIASSICDKVVDSFLKAAKQGFNVNDKRLQDYIFNTVYGHHNFTKSELKYIKNNVEKSYNNI